MKLNKDYRYHVLCEDTQTRTFVNSILSDQGISAWKIRCSNIPCGEGCGEAAVRRGLPKEIKRLKATAYNRQVLIVCTDADKYTVSERKSLLEKEVESHGIEWDKMQDPVMVWIPKRQIETWIRFLDSESVDEDMLFPHSGKPISCKEEAKLFSLYCQGLIELDCSCLKSLEMAKKEYERVCRLQK